MSAKVNEANTTDSTSAKKIDPKVHEKVVNINIFKFFSSAKRIVKYNFRVVKGFEVVKLTFMMGLK